jgi:hypothetical protein
VTAGPCPEAAVAVSVLTRAARDGRGVDFCDLLAASEGLGMPFGSNGCARITELR